MKISKLGSKDQVRRAMAAANATEDTKKWGQKLLDRLASLEPTQERNYV